jgi:hypothetical protein
MEVSSPMSRPRPTGGLRPALTPGCGHYPQTAIRGQQKKITTNQVPTESGEPRDICWSGGRSLDAGVCLVAQFDTVRSGRIQHLRAVKKLRMVVAVVRRNQPITHRRRRWGLG